MWLYVPSHFVPEEPQGSTLDLISLADELHRSVMWRGKRRLAKLWLRALQTDRSNRLPYGRISQHSLRLGFEAWLTSHAPDCPANPTPSPENEKATPTNGPSGPSSFEWWERCSRTWFSSKMFLSFFNTSDQLAKNYRDWATRLRSRSSSQLRTLGLRIAGSEYSYWPTTRSSSGGGNTSDYNGAPYRPALAQWAQSWPSPRTEDGESCGNHPEASDSLTGVTRTWHTPQVMLWRSPDAPGHGGIRNRQASTGEGHQTTIGEQAEQWQTPAADSFRSRGGDRVNEMGLDQQARFWGTPSSHERTHNPREVDHGTQLANQASAWPSPTEGTPNSLRGSGQDPEIRREGGHSINLQDAVSTWPSPQSRDYRSGKTVENYGNARPLNEAIESFRSTSLLAPSPLVPTIQDGEKYSNAPLGLVRRLNPAFVAWLMGLPWWWTNPEPINSARSETESYLCRQRRLLFYLLGGQD
jgi:hypothetical protein